MIVLHCFFYGLNLCSHSQFVFAFDYFAAVLYQAVVVFSLGCIHQCFTDFYKFCVKVFLFSFSKIFAAILISFFFSLNKADVSDM